MNPKTTLVLNVDIQNAFGERAVSAKLRSLRKTERSEVRAAVKISEAVSEAGGAVGSTKDWHNPVGTELPDGQIDNRSAAEVEIYGPHAEAGTSDTDFNAPLEQAMRRMEARVGARTIIPVDQYDATGRQGSARLFELHKNTYDVAKRMTLDGRMVPNEGFIALLTAQVAQGIKTVVVTGKIAEVCVKAAVESIRELFPELEVIVVAEAVSALPEGVAEQIGLESKEQVLARFAALGVRVVSTIDELLPSASFIADGVLGR